MAEPARNISAAERREVAPPKDLPSMLEQLASDGAKLVDQKFALFKLELKEEVTVFVRGGIIIAAGGIIAAVGFALANVALAFLVSTLFAGLRVSQPVQYALGFVITGIAYLVIGSVVIVLAKNRLAKQGIIPERTVNELKKDKEWLQNEM
ncbi:MAG: phage holin family protein [Pyrinomonadaceae bacterium]